MRRACFVACLVLACAGVPEPPAPGTSQVWGQLRLVPREGVSRGGAGGGSYGDRRLRDVEFVDYSQPGFAVVFVEAEPPPGGLLELAIRSTRVNTHLDPAIAAIGAAGRLVVHNATSAAHVLSYPAAGLVQRLEPDERVELALARVGEQGLFVLDVPDAEATIFAAPGPFSVVSQTGRFELRDLAPGRRELRAWHPRFPPTVESVELAADAQLRVDLEMGVSRGSSGHAEEEHAHAH